MGDPFEWQDCGQLALAIPKSDIQPPLPNDEVHTLCGRSLTLTRDDFSRENRYWIRGCKECMTGWVNYQDRRVAR